ncbi:MAG: hypothetical protein AAF483_06635 [Planctomycetota bacterium]
MRQTRPATTALICLAILFGLAQPSYARRVEDWPYDKLMKKSDLVVVVRYVGTVEVEAPSPENPWEAEFQGLQSRFKVFCHLKTDEKKYEPPKTIDFLHFYSERSLQNGPGFVEFAKEFIETESASGIKQHTMQQAQYLLFLKKLPDGRYAATSGQIDPNLSVREMRTPIPPIGGPRQRERKSQ